MDLVAEIGPPLCQSCGRPVKKNEVCRRCKGESLDWIRGWVYYQSPVDQIVHEFKYNDRRSLARFFGRKVASILRSDPKYRKIELIIPIPLHKRKERARGFNQSDLLAREIGRELDIPVERGLVRIRNSRSQTGLTEKERKNNVRGVFELKTAVDNLHVLLVDDVMTTGSTINEAASVLKEYGARSVLGAVAAIAP